MKKKRKIFQLLLALMLVFIMGSGRAAFAEEMTIAGPAAPKETAAKESE